MLHSGITVQHSQLEPLVSVFVAVTLDGFIAESDHSLEFLNEFSSAQQMDDYGFAQFLEETDVLVMGRKTYDVVQTFQEWPYGKLPVVVVTNRPLDPNQETVTSASGPIDSIVKKLAANGQPRIYLDGGALITQGLQADIVTNLILNIVPVSLGSGIPLFASELPRSRWQCISARQFATGLVQVHYKKA